MAEVTLFEALERSIREFGAPADGSIDLSELSLIDADSEEGKAIAFSLLGGSFLLLPSGAVVSLEEDEEAGALGYTVEEKMRAAVHTFLKWRVAFLRSFNI